MNTKTRNSTKIVGNSIFTIFPYKEQGQWMFDDEQKGLYKEAFVAGADDLLDKLCEGAEKCTAMFSSSSFPDHQISMILQHSDEEGSDYYCEKFDHNLWLCPALFKYFPTAPRAIFLKIKK